MSKIGGFTLLETVVAMILAFIVVTMSYFLINTLGRDVQQSMKKMNELNGFNQLEYLISLDCNRAESMIQYGNTIEMINDNQITKYTFKEQSVLRFQEGRSQEMIFDKIDFEIKSIQGLTSSDLISSLYVEITNKKRIWSFSVQKKYSAVELMKIEKNS